MSEENYVMYKGKSYIVINYNLTIIEESCIKKYTRLDLDNKGIKSIRDIKGLDGLSSLDMLYL